MKQKRNLTKEWEVAGPLSDLQRDEIKEQAWRDCVEEFQMLGGVMADKTRSLDARISEALKANGDADRDALVGLLDEAFDEITSLEEIIKVETPRVLDLTNPIPTHQPLR